MRLTSLFLLSLLCLGLPSCSTPPSRTHSLSDSHYALRGATHEELADALTEAEKTMAAGLESDEQRQAYATQVGRVVSLWLALSKNTPEPMAVGSDYRLQPRLAANLRFDELIPANAIKSEELKHRITRGGVGTPFVAHWKHKAERKAAEPFLSEAGYLTPVTATLDFSSAHAGRRTAMLVFHDARVTETVRLKGRTEPLAADLTAYGEYLLSMKSVRMQGIKALLRSSEHMDKLGLIALEHPDPKRIPLVLVHGLMSRPATWQNVVNELGADPEIQQHYQVYLFRYPSGVPIIYSSEKLRENLATLHKTLAAQGAGRTCRNMVLIGHSMGGLVSKAQVQDSGDQVWVNILGNTPSGLGLSKDEYEALRRYMEFHANPNIGRVIFAATPHRGSHVADSRLAHFGRSLVKLPGQTFGTTFSVLESLAARDAFLSELLAKGMPTSVDNLSPKSPYVKIANSLSFRPGVHLHSIIGNKNGLALSDPECTDGFVPYSSAHLEKVESEMIVKSDHSVHMKQEAIDEMRRILRLHLQQINVR
jgi:hypothetical protein